MGQGRPRKGWLPCALCAWSGHFRGQPLAQWDTPYLMEDRCDFRNRSQMGWQLQEV